MAGLTHLLTRQLRPDMRDPRKLLKLLLPMA